MAFPIAGNLVGWAFGAPVSSAMGESLDRSIDRPM